MAHRIGGTIKLNDEFSLEKDKYQWILIRNFIGFNKRTKEATESSEQTYHRTLEQVSAYVLEQSGKVSESLEGVVEAYQKAVDSVTETLTNKIGER